MSKKAKSLVSQSVVSHDTSSTAVSFTNKEQDGKVLAQGSRATSIAIEQLVVEREVWEQNAFRTSNEQLYLLLQKCYGLYMSMESDTADAKALRKGLGDYINLKGLRFLSGTHTITKIVKCVFGMERRRVSAYSIALRAALENKIAIADIPNFIRGSGGVEELRVTSSATGMSLKEKAEVAKQSIDEKSIGTVSGTAFSSRLDNGKIGQQVLILGTWQADGSVLLHNIVESESILNAALASQYSADKAAGKKAQKAIEASKDASKLDAAVKVAAMEAELV